MVYWDADALKDLLIGQADGKIKIFLNVGTEADPTFDGGTFLQVGPIGSKTDIDVGSRATLDVADWNNDDKKDLIVGAIDGKIHVFINEGSDTSPDFASESFAQQEGADLVVPSYRSSPVIGDFDGDGKKDLLTGNTNGEILLYPNVGMDAAPSFSDSTYFESEGVVIDLNSLGRSRPSVCDWRADGRPDLLVGVGDGRVHLYQSKTYVSAVSPWSLVLMSLCVLLVAAYLSVRRRIPA